MAACGAVCPRRRLLAASCAAEPGGQAPPPKLGQINDDVFWPDVNVKVMGYLRCIREAVPHMVGRGGGRIVNVSGLATRNTGSTVGSMRNVAVAAMTKNLAEELGPQGISVIVVHPALTRTEKTPRSFDVDPDGNYVFGAGEGSGKLAVFRVDPKTGALTRAHTYAIGKSLTWVLAVKTGER